MARVKVRVRGSMRARGPFTAMDSPLQRSSSIKRFSSRTWEKAIEGGGGLVKGTEGILQPIHHPQACAHQGARVRASATHSARELIKESACISLARALPKEEAVRR